MRTRSLRADRRGAPRPARAAPPAASWRPAWLHAAVHDGRADLILERGGAAGEQRGVQGALSSRHPRRRRGPGAGDLVLARCSSWRVAGVLTDAGQGVPAVLVALAASYDALSDSAGWRTTAPWPGTSGAPPAASRPGSERLDLRSSAWRCCWRTSPGSMPGWPGHPCPPRRLLSGVVQRGDPVSSSWPGSRPLWPVVASTSAVGASAAAQQLLVREVDRLGRSSILSRAALDFCWTMLLKRRNTLMWVSFGWQPDYGTLRILCTDWPPALPLGASNRIAPFASPGGVSGARRTAVALSGGRGRRAAAAWAG